MDFEATIELYLRRLEGSIVAASGVADQRAYSQTGVTLRRSHRRRRERENAIRTDNNEAVLVEFRSMQNPPVYLGWLLACLTLWMFPFGQTLPKLLLGPHLVAIRSDYAP
jgi:hypothetical protein